MGKEGCAAFTIDRICHMTAAILLEPYPARKFVANGVINAVFFSHKGTYIHIETELSHSSEEFSV